MARRSEKAETKRVATGRAFNPSGWSPSKGEDKPYDQHDGESDEAYALRKARAMAKVDYQRQKYADKIEGRVVLDSAGEFVRVERVRGGDR